MKPNSITREKSASGEIDLPGYYFEFTAKADILIVFNPFDEDDLEIFDRDVKLTYFDLQEEQGIKVPLSWLDTKTREKVIYIIDNALIDELTDDDCTADLPEYEPELAYS
jgi:hypothetical protein